MLRLFKLLGLTVTLATFLPTGVRSQPEGPPVIKLTTKTTAGPRQRALKYALLPDSLDLKPGNAAPLWLRAGQSARQTSREVAQKDPKALDKEHEWSSTTPLKDFPRAEVRAALDRYRTALLLADRAARFQRCDWERPPLTIQYLQEDLLLDDVQSVRNLANLLSLRCRLELADCQFDKATYTLQTGFALARDVGDGADLVLHDLVGIAIQAIMFTRVEEFLQQPGAPNLYWALTTLPSPLIDVRQAMRNEMGTLYRSFPGLRNLEDRKMNAAQVEALIEEVMNGIGSNNLPEMEGLLNKAGLTAAAAKVYPEAKKYFLDRGRSEDQLKAMPQLQVVLAYYMSQYDCYRDEVIKWLRLPPWQARPGLVQAEKELKASPQTLPNVLLRLLMPALLKVHEAHVRTERYVAGLRCAEAVRLYAAAHEGKLPAKLADVTEVPLPIDPMTGKGFDDFYKLEGDKAVLAIPPPAGQPAIVGRRYEITRGQ
jgi:hypothetical protein